MNIALILSGGTGTRLGEEIPKQYIEVGGKLLISYCLETFFTHPLIDAVQIVADAAWRDVITKEVGENGKFRGFSDPGANRQMSIFNGLEDIWKYACDTDCVLIHDAARPLLPENLVTDCLMAMNGHDGVLPVLPMKDTVYFSDDGKKVAKLLEREKLYAGQAPEAFVLGKYYEANQKLLPERILQINGSTEAAIFAGMDIVMIPGEEKNFKITTKADLDRFKEMLRSE